MIALHFQAALEAVLSNALLRWLQFPISALPRVYVQSWCSAISGSWNVLQVDKLLPQHSLVVLVKKAMLCTPHAACILQCEGKIITASPETEVLKLISRRP